jgi:hypothetical protein
MRFFDLKNDTQYIEMSDRQMNALELQQSGDGFPKESTFRNYLTILNAVNKHYDWDQNIIYYDRLNDNAQEIANFCFAKWQIANTAQFKQKMSALSSLMTHTGFGKDHDIKLMCVNADQRLSVANTKQITTIADWNELLPQLKKLGNERSVNGIIARIFSCQYVLRVAEIFTTIISDDDDVTNFLDLNECIWHIRDQKNGTEIVFDVNKELCKSLKPRIPRKWLLSKRNGQPYGKSSQRLPYHHWPLPSNNDIRKSYETWNRNHPTRTEEERNQWSSILGHTPATVAATYDQARAPSVYIPPPTRPTAPTPASRTPPTPASRTPPTPASRTTSTPPTTRPRPRITARRPRIKITITKKQHTN